MNTFWNNVLPFLFVHGAYKCIVLPSRKKLSPIKSTFLNKFGLEVTQTRKVYFILCEFLSGPMKEDGSCVVREINVNNCDKYYTRQHGHLINLHLKEEKLEV